MQALALLGPGGACGAVQWSELLERSRTSGPYDLYCCDMNAPPAVATDLLLQALPLLRAGAVVVLTFKNTFKKPAPWHEACEAALARLRSYPWPGNVLELRNAVERAARLAAGGEVLSEHLPSADLQAGRGRGRLRQRVDSIERDAIMKALADNNHNQTHAARRLGISRRALIYKMEKYGLKPPPGKGRR